jgi:hypothetical protein
MGFLVTRTKSLHSVELFRGANEEVNKLFSLMDQVQGKLNKKSKGKYIVQNLKRASWEDVMSEIQSTSQRWSNLPAKIRGRGFLEKIGQHSEAFQAWIGLLPAGDYGSGICGVFKLAIGVSVDEPLRTGENM